MYQSPHISEGGTNAELIECYVALGVPVGASFEDVKAAHRVLARQYHPDLVPQEARESATSYMQAINVAYDALRAKLSSVEEEKPSDPDEQMKRAWRWFQKVAGAA